MGRKRAPSRVASQLKALQKAGDTTKVIKAENAVKIEAAHLEKQRLKTEKRQLYAEEIEADLSVYAAKDELRAERIANPPPRPAHGAVDFVTKDGTPVHIPATRDLSITVDVAPPAKYESTSSVNRDGRVVWEVLRGRDGQPVLKKPEPAQAAPAVATEPARPKTRVEEMRERYLAHHKPGGVWTDGGNTGGWFDHGGVVGRNISTEGGMDLRTSRLRLTDF